MDIVTYALLKKRIEGLTPGYTYKGSVASTSALPEDPEQGDLYTVTGEGNAQYVWDGSEWINLSAEIARLNSEITTISEAVDDTTTGLNTKAPVIVENASGSIASFSDGADGMPVKNLVVDVDPVQDLHGYDHPWPAGGGKNKWKPLTSRTVSGVTFTVSDNGKVTLNGTADALILETVQLPSQLAAGTYTMSASNTVQNSGVNLRVATTTSTTAGDLPLTEVNASLTFTVADPIISVVIRVGNGVAVTNLEIFPQIEEGSTATTFAPYSNICPISGHTGANVPRTGKNLLDKANGAKNLYVGAGDKTGTGGTLLCFVAKQGTQYTISMTGGNRTNLYYYDTKSLDDIVSGITLNVVTLSATKPYTFIADHDAVYCYYADTYFQQTVADSCMVELGSTATAYEPYTAVTKQITFPAGAGTVYGATITQYADGSGKMVVDRVKFSTTWGSNQGGASVGNNVRKLFTSTSFVVSNEIADRPKQKCNIAPLLYNYTQDSVHFYATYNSSLSRSEFLVFLPVNTDNDTVIDIICPLATPVEYTLTAEQVGALLTTLKGTNNVWADTGNVELEYCADTEIFVTAEAQTLFACIAPTTEDGATASQAYAQGKYFLRNGQFCKAKTAIASGATFTLGTNYEVTTIADELFSALNS